jgi:hypothetical protein
MPDFARPKLWAPPGVGDEARADEAELMQQVVAVEYMKALYEPDLKAIDETCELVLANAKVSPNTGLKAGYWHIIRHEPGFVSYVKPLEWGNGEPRDPGSWMYEELMRDDFWSNRSKRVAKERNEKLAAARKRELDREAMDRAGDYDERYKNANTTQILVPAGYRR